MNYKKPIIALDCDGVLLNYGLAFSKRWAKFTGIEPTEIDQKAYWHMERWDIKRLSGEELASWRKSMDFDFYSTMPAIPGALPACERLHNMGYELICVTALSHEFAVAREKNLRDLGFPISEVYTTGNNLGTNPKKAVIHQINPEVFVDDYLPYFDGINPQIFTVLILREINGSPNIGLAVDAMSSTHLDLKSFSSWWCERKI